MPLASLGLARRAGVLALGVDSVRRALRSGEARLIIVARDAAPSQTGKVVRLAGHRGVRCVPGPDRSDLGRVVGAPPLSAVAVTADSFAERALQEILSSGGGGRIARPNIGSRRRDAGF